MSIIRVSNLILGLFLISFSTYAFSLGGNSLKYISLLLGFILLVMNSKLVFNIQKNSRIFINAILLFSIYVIISFIQKQATFNFLTVIFDFICMTLFLCGFYLKKINRISVKFLDIYKILISFLLILGSYKLFLVQTSGISYNSFSRNYGDDFLNPNAIAFTVAQIIIIMSFLISIETKNNYKILLIITSLIVFVNLLLTQSRGALLFLIITLTFGFKHNFKNVFKLKSLIITILIFIIIFRIIINNQIYLIYLEALGARFESFINFTTSNYQNDGSISDRLESYKQFYNNFSNLYFGQLYYKPYPHNQFIEIIFRWGVFGLPVLLISLISIFMLIKNLLKKSISKISLHYLLTLLFLFSYFQSMTSLSLDNNRILWLGFGLFLPKIINRSN